VVKLSSTEGRHRLLSHSWCAFSHSAPITRCAKVFAPMPASMPAALKALPPLGTAHGRRGRLLRPSPPV
jgi:hypothetical protein